MGLREDQGISSPVGHSSHLGCAKDSSYYITIKIPEVLASTSFTRRMYVPEEESQHHLLHHCHHHHPLLTVVLEHGVVDGEGVGVVGLRPVVLLALLQLPPILPRLGKLGKW